MPETKTPHTITWEAPEHTHIEKTSDWYWILGIIAVAGSIASIIFNNALFGIVILLGAATMAIVAQREPRIVQFELSGKGLRIENDLYPYSTLDSFDLQEENLNGPLLLIKSKKLFVPLFVIPIPEEYIQAIEEILWSRLEEEHLEEPLSHQLLEFFGF